MGFEEKKIVYFDEESDENTDKTLDLAIKYAKEKQIKKIIIASSTGKTALILKEKAPDIEIVAVTYGAGQMKFKDKIAEWNRNETKILNKGILIVKGLHALSGVNRSITNKYKTASYLDVMADTLRIVSQGFKVCVEISVMVAEAGLISPKEEVIVIGGSGEGSDTALAINPAYATNIFELKIKEILCLPRK